MQGYSTGTLLAILGTYAVLYEMETHHVFSISYRGGSEVARFFFQLASEASGSELGRQKQVGSKDTLSLPKAFCHLD